MLLNLWISRLGYVALVSLLLHIGYSDAARKYANCEKNLECCRHHPWSAEFRECCKEDCCPDCNLVHYVPAIRGFAMKDCEDSYECCVYPMFSKPYLECCNKHVCCPLCYMVSKGCCYNGTVHSFGSVVERLPELNLELVCGAKVQTTKPFFVAAIVPLDGGYYSDEACEYCGQNQYCLHNGIIHGRGEEWFETPCSLCSCYERTYHCRPVKPKCPPPPYPSCASIPPKLGDCCNEWDCSILQHLCVDVYGVVRREGEQWTGHNDPCLLYMCKPGGMILNARRSCPPSKAMSLPAGCELLHLPHECCPVLHCPECEAEDGTTYEAGDTWDDPEDPCFTFTCHKGGRVRRMNKVCPVLHQPPRVNCVLQEENCCPEWICGGCIDKQGKVHALGATWTDEDDPCITYTCTELGIRLSSRDDCPPLGPPPAPSCQKVKKNCCDVWKCIVDVTYCIDAQGVRREVGDEWLDPVNPCIQCLCTEELEVIKAIRDCARPPPPPSDTCFMEVEQCCPVWRCPCIDEDGLERVVGDVWEHPTNKCLTRECTSDGVGDKPQPCQEIPPQPHPHCVLDFDGCCLAWKCPTSKEECPDPNSFNTNCIHFLDQCRYDEQCGPDLKCCLVAGCGHECMTVSKRGTCPVIQHIVAPNCTPDMRDFCQYDHQCPDRQKCCLFLCTKQCVDPIY